MWHDKFGALRVVTLAASSLDPLDVDARVYGTATLARMAESKSHRALMWFTPEIRGVILCASWCHGDLYRESRAAAMAALWQFSFDPVLKVLMWNDPKTRTSVIKAVQNDPPDLKVQLYGLDIERNWAEAKINRLPMWAYGANSGALTRAVDSQKLVRSFAMAAVTVLAFCGPNKAKMWWDNSLVLAVEKVALDDEPSAITPAGLGRNYAFAFYQLLAAAEGNRRAMYNDEFSVNGALVAGCTAAWSAAGVGSRGRTYSLTTYMILTSVSSNSYEMWRDAPVVSCLAENSAVPAEGAEVLQFEPAAQQEALPSDTLIQTQGRASGLSAIVGMTKSRDNQREMWAVVPEDGDKFTVRKHVIDAAAQTSLEMSVFRLIGLQGLRNLAQERLNRLDMWNTAPARIALIDAGRLGTSEDMSKMETRLWARGLLNLTRQHGLCGLANLAQGPGVQKPMLRDRDAREALINGGRIRATSPVDAAAKACAIRAFASLAAVEDNQVMMWQDNHISRTLMHNAQSKDPIDQEAQMFAVIALQELSDASANQGEMWTGKEVGLTGVGADRRRRNSRRLLDSDLAQTTWEQQHRLVSTGRFLSLL